jgi:hypothetical protein
MLIPCLVYSSSALLFKKASYLAILSLIGINGILFNVILAPICSKEKSNSLAIFKISFEKLVHLL